MDKKVSIIVPIYNVEKYICECVQSLISQSYKNIEIILVDDSSPDSCGKICDEFAEKDSRITVIHKPNGGAASARNVGIDHATGDYICFVDSDDTVETNYVKTLIDALGDGDMAMCGFYMHTRSGSSAESIVPGSYGREAFIKRFLDDWSCSCLWNKIFRKDAIGDLRMEEGHRVDDEFFTYRVALNCYKITITDECLYHYRLRSSSVMQDCDDAKERMMLDRISYITARYETVSSALPELKEAYFRDAADTLCRYWIHSLNMPTAQKQIRRWVWRHSFELILIGKIGIGLLRCFLLSRPMYCGEPNTLQRPNEEYFD